MGGGGCSELRSCHCTPAWVTEEDSISKKVLLRLYSLSSIIIFFLCLPKRIKKKLYLLGSLKIFIKTKTLKRVQMICMWKDYRDAFLSEVPHDMEFQGWKTSVKWETELNFY